MDSPRLLDDIIVGLAFFAKSLRDIRSLSLLDKHFNKLIAKNERIWVFILRKNFPRVAQQLNDKYSFSAWITVKTLFSAKCIQCGKSSKSLISPTKLLCAENETNLFSLSRNSTCHFCTYHNYLDKNGIVFGDDDDIYGATIDKLIEVHVVGEKKDNWDEIFFSFLFSHTLAIETHTLLTQLYSHFKVAPKLVKNAVRYLISILYPYFSQDTQDLIENTLTEKIIQFDELEIKQTIQSLQEQHKVEKEQNEQQQQEQINKQKQIKQQQPEQQQPEQHAAQQQMEQYSEHQHPEHQTKKQQKELL